MKCSTDLPLVLLSGFLLIVIIDTINEEEVRGHSTKVNSIFCRCPSVEVIPHALPVSDHLDNLSGKLQIVVLMV